MLVACERAAAPMFYCEPVAADGARLCVPQKCPPDIKCITQSEAACAESRRDGETYCFASMADCEDMVDATKRTLVGCTVRRADYFPSR